MRKWLFLLLAVAVLYAVASLNTPKRRARYPLLKRLNRTLTILAWTLLAAYGIAFLYWVLTQVRR